MTLLAIKYFVFRINTNEFKYQKFREFDTKNEEIMQSICNNPVKIMKTLREHTIV